LLEKYGKAKIPQGEEGILGGGRGQKKKKKKREGEVQEGVYVNANGTLG